MTTPTQQDAASMFSPFNSCAHLRSPGAAASASLASAIGGLGAILLEVSLPP